jgi:DNA-binding beta-propeller fold protein YncE
MSKTLQPRTFVLVFLFASAMTAGSQEQGREPLMLVQTIQMPNVKGRIDHMDVDVKGKRLFVSGLENGSLEIVDLRAGKWKSSIPGFKEPQGVVYDASLNKLFVASGEEGLVKVFRGDTLDPLDSIEIGQDPDRVAFDTSAQLLYVGCGGKVDGKVYGAVGIIDTKNDKRLPDIQISDHPGEILLDKSGGKLYVFVSIVSRIQVIDAKKRQILSTWEVSSQRPADAAFDEANHRLLMATRIPARMIAMDSNTGKEVADLPTAEGMDGVYFNASQKRLYVSGGRGFDAGYVFVYQQDDADHYREIARVPTRPGAGTSFWSPELNRFYVAAPANGKDEAAILVFMPQK